jgi:hypothetical protein
MSTLVIAATVGHRDQTHDPGDYRDHQPYNNQPVPTRKAA